MAGFIRRKEEVASPWEWLPVPTMLGNNIVDIRVVGAPAKLITVAPVKFGPLSDCVAPRGNRLGRRLVISLPSRSMHVVLMNEKKRTRQQSEATVHSSLRGFKIKKFVPVERSRPSARGASPSRPFFHRGAAFAAVSPGKISAGASYDWPGRVSASQLRQLPWPRLGIFLSATGKGSASILLLPSVLPKKG